MATKRGHPYRHNTTGNPSPYLRVAVDDGVATVTIARPPTNALVGPVIDDLVAAFARLEAESAVRAVVITGGIRNVFSSGGDLDAVFRDMIRGAREGNLVETLVETLENMQRGLCIIEEFPKPTVAAINGVCIGAGLELALVCDLRVASELAYCVFPELSLGIIPGLGATQRLARVIGLGRTKEMLLIGRRIRAQRALDWGLVHRLAPHRQTLAVAVDLAREVGAKSSRAFAALKRAIQHARQAALQSGLQNDTREFTALMMGALGETDGGKRQ
jgi:enoyl-CoA hydratase/carnithine racemase